MIGFAAYETVAFSITNFNFGGHTPSAAQKLVQEGQGRWALCHGNVLTFVPLDYILKEFEHFLQQTPTGFEVVP